MAKEIRTKAKQCKSLRLDGNPCQAPVVSPSGYCISHDPAREAQRAVARRKGGHNRAHLVRLRGLVPPRLVSVYDTLETALAEVHDGTLSPGQAGAMAALARALVSVLQAGELEERLRLIESERRSTT